MLIEVDTVKGFQDCLPPESLKRQAIKKIAEKYFKLYGFMPIETPIVELDEIMKPDSLPNEQEDEAVSDRFRLKDRGGRNLGLRYEFTFQLARLMKMNPNIKLPFKRYQIGEVFRDEPLRTGRTRQFTQCDIDIIGDSSINSEVECLAVIGEIFKEIGIDFEIHLNNRKLLDAMLESVEMRDKKNVMREIDKLSKIGEDLVKLNLKKYSDSNRIMTLFKLLEKDLSFFKENMFEGAAELIELFEKAKQYNLEVKFVPSLVRGFGYYTGNIFEFFIKGTKTSICGGGRYDKSVGKYLNRDIPAVGISFSLEALMGLCPEQISKLKIEPMAKAAIISVGRDKEALQLAKELREEEISCITMFDKIGKILEYSDSYKIPFAIFIGDNEIAKKKFKLRNLNSGEEKEMAKKTLINFLKKN